MDNAEHLEILKQGVDVWNQWRDEHPDIRPDLRDADLSGPDLRDEYLHLTDFSEVQLSGADLNGPDLSEAHLGGADLRGAHLRNAYLRNAYLRNVYLGGADLSGVDFSDADLSDANLSDANFSDANLRGARLRGANLSDASLRGANLSDADLSLANLTRVDLTKADLSLAYVGGTTFGDVNLSEVVGLDTITHFESSTIGIDTIYKSKGSIPEVFLRGCGVPDNFIEYMGSLTGKAFDFYSCFISYSSKNHDFAERLHADLQNKGVRCWFAPEDMKIGDRTRRSIDEAIRFHDKLLIILSEQSIDSDWVETEVETALEKEIQKKRTVLFPIRLDDTVMETSQAWAGKIRRERHIGDFRHWKDHDPYQKAFDRLMRDLQAE